jgi:hypothetical protein
MTASVKCWSWHVKDTQTISCKSPCLMILFDWHLMVVASFRVLNAYSVVTPATAHVTHRSFMMLLSVSSRVPDSSEAIPAHIHALRSVVRYAHRNARQSSRTSQFSSHVVTLRHLFHAGFTMNKTRLFVMKLLRVRSLDAVTKSKSAAVRM